MGEVVELAAVRDARGGRERPMTKAEVAAHYKVSVRTVTRWMAAGLPYDKPYEGGSVRFRMSECEGWFRRRR